MEQTKALLGQRIDNDQILLKSILGRGAFASVFLGINVTIARQYAVKTLFKKLMSPREIRMQQREIDYLKQVSGHRNIVTLVKVIETPEYIFLILEKCEMDLFDAITCQKQFPNRYIREVMLQLIAGLEHCHGLGIYHR